MHLMKTTLCLLAIASAPAFAAVNGETTVRSCTELIDMSLSNLNPGERKQLISTCKTEKWKLVIGQAAPVKAEPEVLQTAEIETDDASAR